MDKIMLGGAYLSLALICLGIYATAKRAGAKQAALCIGVGSITGILVCGIQLAGYANMAESVERNLSLAEAGYLSKEATIKLNKDISYIKAHPFRFGIFDLDKVDYVDPQLASAKTECLRPGMEYEDLRLTEIERKLYFLCRQLESTEKTKDGKE